MEERERLAGMCGTRIAVLLEEAGRLRQYGAPNYSRLYTDAHAEELERAAADWRTIAAILRSAPAGQRIEAALEQAAKWFREYEQIHATKAAQIAGDVTRGEIRAVEAADARRKADRNRERAEFCEAALHATPEAGGG